MLNKLVLTYKTLLLQNGIFIKARLLWRFIWWKYCETLTGPFTMQLYKRPDVRSSTASGRYRCGNGYSREASSHQPWVAFIYVIWTLERNWVLGNCYHWNIKTRIEPSSPRSRYLHSLWTRTPVPTTALREWLGQAPRHTLWRLPLVTGRKRAVRWWSLDGARGM